MIMIPELPRQAWFQLEVNLESKMNLLSVPQRKYGNHIGTYTSTGANFTCLFLIYR